MTEKNRIVEDPDLKSATTAVKEAIARHRCIVLVGRCRVEYQGRARSTLEPGERIIIIKEDGAILVHRPTGYEPVNWQPAGCRLQTSLIEETLVVESFRRAPSETLRVVFEEVHVFLAMKLLDTGSFDLHVSEKEMQRAIVAEPQLLEEGFKPIAYEKKVDPGFLDLYGVDGADRLVVVEIKRVKAGKSAILQLARYVEDVRKNSNREVRGILAAPQVSKGMQRLLATLNLEYRRIDLAKCAHAVEMKKGKRKIHEFF